MDYTHYTRSVALLAVGLLATLTVLYRYIDDEHGSNLPSASGRVARASKLSGFQNQGQLRLLPTQQKPGRRLQVSLDPEIQRKQLRNFLGGLYSPVDSSNLPLFLRSVNSEPRGTDIIFFWHIPKAAGSTAKNILNFCFDLKRAEQLTEEPSMEFAKDNILNMDTSSPDGLEFSFANQIVNSGMIDVVVSNYFLSGAALFTDAHYGKTFTILRHPAEIALSLFNYRRKAKWERSYRKDFNKMSFSGYISSDHYMGNWMTRQLTATPPWVDLKETHLDWAKRVMEEKIFVGEMTQLDETFRQLKAHYGWESPTPALFRDQTQANPADLAGSDCVHQYLHATPTNANKEKNKSSPSLKPGGKTWKLLVEKEKWDMNLYYFGLELFAKQSLRYPPN